MNALTEQQKARIVELAQRAVSQLGYAYMLLRYQDNDHMYAFAAMCRVKEASAEAFRIAQEAR